VVHFPPESVVHFAAEWVVHFPQNTQQERIVFEIKKTRQGLDAKALGSQLIEDIARYQAYPDCEALVCFVYDPDGRISNPRGIENDLRRKEGDLFVEVLIKP